MRVTKSMKVYEKYSGRCAYCGYRIYPDADVAYPFKATVDHITPQANGGTDTLSNLLPACFDCNRVKDDMPLNDFRNALLTGKADKKGKSVEVKELRSPRYMVPYGRYPGISGYMWGGKFYFEKNSSEKAETERIADIVQPSYGNADIINGFFKNKNIASVTASVTATPLVTKSLVAKPLTTEPPAATPLAATPLAAKSSVKPADLTVSAPRMKAKGNIIIVDGKNATVNKKPTKSEKKHIYATYDNRCAYCGCVIRSENMPYGHYNACISLLDNSIGYVWSNMVAGCQECESIKRYMSLEDFRSNILVKKGEDVITSVAKSVVKRVLPLYENHYAGILMSKKFYFELPETAKKTVREKWNLRGLSDSVNQPVLSSITSASGVPAVSISPSAGLLPSAGASLSVLLPSAGVSPGAAAAGAPAASAAASLDALEIEYQKLLAEQKEYQNKADAIGEKLKKLRTVMDEISKAIDILNEL